MYVFCVTIMGNSHIEICKRIWWGNEGKHEPNDKTTLVLDQSQASFSNFLGSSFKLWLLVLDSPLSPQEQTPQRVAVARLISFETEIAFRSCKIQCIDASSFKEWHGEKVWWNKRLLERNVKEVLGLFFCQLKQEHSSSRKHCLFNLDCINVSQNQERWHVQAFLPR